MDSPTIEAKKDDLRMEYDRKLEMLQKQYEDEYKSKCQMETYLLALKKQYEEDMARINKQVRLCLTIIILLFNKHLIVVRCSFFFFFKSFKI